MPTTWLDTVASPIPSGGELSVLPLGGLCCWTTRSDGCSPNPADLAAALELTGSETVLELGPGSGFFSREVAGRLPRGRLELFDIQPEMLAKARRKLDGARSSERGLQQR